MVRTASNKYFEHARLVPAPIGPLNIALHDVQWLGKEGSALGQGLKRPRDDQGDTPDNPIDVDQLHSIFEPSVVKTFVWPKVIDLKLSEIPPRIKSKESFTAWCADGKEETFTPEAHFPEFLDFCSSFMARAQEYYIEGEPRFLSAPDRSCLTITTYEAFNKLDDKGKQQFLSGKTAGIIRQWPVDPNLKFNAKGMRTLTSSLIAPVDLQVYSLPQAKSKVAPVAVTGKAQDILDNAHDGGHIINGLVPRWDGRNDPSAFAVDTVAWEHTRLLHFSDEFEAYPGFRMNWALAGHKWAIANNRVDADGAFTRSLVGCGLQGWGFLVERPGGPKLSSLDFFLDRGFELSSVLESKPEGKNSAVSKYDIEFVILRPGDMLYMKPNTPHFVITLEHSICYGGHSFSTDTMQQTLIGLIHTFVLHGFLTNAAHHPSRLLFRRILIFYYVGLLEDKLPEDDPMSHHLPDYRNIDGLLNLLSVCVLAIMGNVLDFRTYSSPNQYEGIKASKRLKDLMDRIDLNSIPGNERKVICYARGVALRIMAWVRACCTVRGPDGEIVEDFPSQFSVQIINSTLNYKKHAEAASRGSGPHCTYRRLFLQISNVVACDPHLKNMWLKRDRLPSDSLELAEKSKYRVEWQANWEQKWGGPKQDFLRSGMTEFDKMYFNGYKEWLHLVHDILPKLGPLAKKVKQS